MQIGLFGLWLGDMRVVNTFIFVLFSFLTTVMILPTFGTEQDEYDMEHRFSPQLYEKACLFHSFHKEENPLILPNAWDALSARIFEQAGAKAIATTSAGIAAVFGYADGQRMPKDLLFMMIDRIVKSVTVPVTVDLEAGFGDTTEEICETVLGILKIGAVGINIEDADPKRPGRLFPIDDQVEKIKAIKTLAQKVNIPLFVNVRTDVFWLNLFTTPEEQLTEALIRLKSYQDAGADGVFVPGLTHSDLIREVTKVIHVPLNLLAGSWIEDGAILKLFGVSRLTLGSAATRECAGHLKTFAHRYLEGNYQINPTLTYSEFNFLFDKV
jgi:2-methylisocitrate lyase-like PEP mutase family enzyme